MTDLFQNLFKEAGGPGSGVREDNAKPIPESILKQSQIVRIGGRKGIMDTQPHEERVISVKDLKYACQDNYVPGKFERIKEKMGSGELDDKPIAVMEVDGELHVLDGHHRAMAAIALKKKKIKAEVYQGVNKKMEKKAFWEGFHKQANMLEHGVELAGLGILARPSIQKLRGQPVSHKSEARHELAGLGVLAAPSAVHLGKKIFSRGH